MKPCIHRYELEDSVRFGCTSPSLIHNGTVAPETCDRCPFSIAPEPAVALPEIVPDFCSQQTQFVWFYIPTTDDGLELKLSMRSVVKHFQGEVKTTVIGDRPSWYSGHHIPCPRISRNKRERSDFHPFRDTANKIVVAADHPEVDESFIWIMDDVYLIRPTAIEDLSTPRFDPWYRPNRRRGWHMLISATFSALSAKGYPNRQAGTHLPHLLRKGNLRQMFEEFDFPKRLLLFEILYSNRFHKDAIPHPPFLIRYQRQPTSQQLDKAAEVSNVLNYVGNCWRTTMRSWVQSRFPEPTVFES